MSRRLALRCLSVFMLLLVAFITVGCRTVGFYGQAVKGQWEIFSREEPLAKVMGNPSTPERLKERFGLLRALLAFGEKDLHLPVNGHYREYADVHRPFVVWNVEAAPEFSLEARTWWYPLVGSLEYRGYFSERGATNYAAYLQRKGEDVYVDGVPAYSTLGWFKDPVLNTFIYEPDAELAETVFHELGHQRLFAHGDTHFNEAFATTVGEEGARRWLKGRGALEAYARYVASLQRTRQFARLIADTRARLESLYGDERTDEGVIKATRKNQGVPAEELRRKKQEIISQLRQDYAQLKAQWNGAANYDEWFNHEINNAKLNSVAAYYDLVPGFEQMLASNGGDLEKFYAAAERLSKRPKKERLEWLRTMGSSEFKDQSPPPAVRHPQSVAESQQVQPHSQ